MENIPPGVLLVTGESLPATDKSLVGRPFFLLPPLPEDTEGLSFKTSDICWKLVNSFTICSHRPTLHNKQTTPTITISQNNILSKQYISYSAPTCLLKSE